MYFNGCIKLVVAPHNIVFISIYLGQEFYHEGFLCFTRIYLPFNRGIIVVIRDNLMMFHNEDRD